MKYQENTLNVRLGGIENVQQFQIPISFVFECLVYLDNQTSSIIRDLNILSIYLTEFKISIKKKINL